MSNKVAIGIALLVVVLVGLPPACAKARRNAGEPVAAGGAAVSGKATENADITGTYKLVSVDGHAVPYAPMHGGHQAPQVVSGTLTLDSGGTFVSTMSYGNPSGSPMSRDFKGTYSKEGAGYVLAWEGAGRTSVTIDGNKLTMNNEGMLFVYER